MAKGRKGSISWNSISKVLEVLEDGFRIKLGDGNMWFWFDAWVVKELLAKRVSWVDIHDIHLKVKEVWVSPEWTFEGLYTALPCNIPHLIQNITS